MVNRCPETYVMGLKSAVSVLNDANGPSRAVADDLSFLESPEVLKSGAENRPEVSVVTGSAFRGHTVDPFALACVIDPGHVGPSVSGDNSDGGLAVEPLAHDDKSASKTWRQGLFRNLQGFRGSVSPRRFLFLADGSRDEKNKDEDLFQHGGHCESVLLRVAGARLNCRAPWLGMRNRMRARKKCASCRRWGQW